MQPPFVIFTRPSNYSVPQDKELEDQLRTNRLTWPPFWKHFAVPSYGYFGFFFFFTCLAFPTFILLISKKDSQPKEFAECEIQVLYRILHSRRPNSHNSTLAALSEPHGVSAFVKRMLELGKGVAAELTLGLFRFRLLIWVGFSTPVPMVALQTGSPHKADILFVS